MCDVFSSIKGAVSRWDVIVIGHLKWNPFFGESPAAPPRGDPSTCTSVMARGMADGKPYALIMDPTLRSRPEDLHFDVFRRTGLKPEEVTHCFITHHHFDHQAGARYFPDACWCASPKTAERLASSELLDGGRVMAVSGEFLPGIAAVPLPGHTMDLAGLAFMKGGLRIIAASDSVMTGDHFIAETGMFEEDAVLAAETIRLIKGCADVVVCGHDNAIFNDRRQTWKK